MKPHVGCGPCRNAQQRLGYWVGIIIVINFVLVYKYSLVINLLFMFAEVIVTLDSVLMYVYSDCD